ncbi:MAG: phosphatidate cytidylyltransferase [Ghiorsea sp.]|nr:phosphatidate cytidylyltransferase [Ghiorsea sp.]
MSELQKRVVTAIFLIAAAVYWMFYTSEGVFNLLAVALGLLALVELLAMLSLGVGLLYIVTLAIPSLFWIWSADTIPVLFPLMIPFVFWLLIFLVTHRHNNTPEHFARFVYLQSMTILLMLFCYTLIVVHHMPNGVLFLSGAFLGVWAADIAAYFTGKAMGKTKLCPSISPGKSVEGFMGGLVLGTITAAVFWVQMLDMPMLTAVALALMLVLISVAGDLGESALKRAVGVKDSGRMLPGHGGILDRIDALLPSIPFVAMLWMVLS